jgi:hypothetical protein
MARMTVTLAKFYAVNVKPHWPLVIAVLLVAVAIAGVIIWRGSKKGG